MFDTKNKVDKVWNHIQLGCSCPVLSVCCGFQPPMMLCLTRESANGVTRLVATRSVLFATLINHVKSSISKVNLSFESFWITLCSWHSLCRHETYLDYNFKWKNYVIMVRKLNKQLLSKYIDLTWTVEDNLTICHVFGNIILFCEEHRNTTSISLSAWNDSTVKSSATVDLNIELWLSSYAIYLS